MKIFIGHIEELANSPYSLIHPEDISDEYAMEAYISFKRSIRLFYLRLDNLILSTRAMNVVQKNNLNSVLDLYNLSKKEVNRLKNCGPTIKREIQKTVYFEWNIDLINWY